MSAESTGLKDIPGVLGPIEDPNEIERRRLYADPKVNVPMIEMMSNYNPLPLISKIIYYTFEFPLDVAHKAFESIKVVKPRRYYHQKFRRVPNIWECATDDMVCVYEAECQFKRDMKVDQEIIEILGRRLDVCTYREGVNHIVYCKDIIESLQKVKEAWQIKYGDLGIYANAKTVLQKQKNRFIEDRYLARVRKDSANGSE